MTLNEKMYNKFIDSFNLFLQKEIENKFISYKALEYKSYFTQSGEWDKRRKYFEINIRLYKSNSSILELGGALVKIGEFIQDNSNAEIYMKADFMTSNYNDNINIKIKFISYDMAAKILLTQ
ncbi:MAG: hypothetical protein ACOC3V_04565 [bacterium]